MRQVVEELKRVLSKELEVYKKLLEFGKAKRKVLVEKFSSELQNIVSQEELCVQELLDLEPKRQDCVSIIAGNSEAKLEEVTSFIDEKDGKSVVLQIAENLRSVINEIQSINEGNQRLVEQALELTQYSVKLITRVPKPVTYGKGGKFENTSNQSRSILNLKA